MVVELAHPGVGEQLVVELDPVKCFVQVGTSLIPWDGDFRSNFGSLQDIQNIRSDYRQYKVVFAGA